MNDLVVYFGASLYLESGMLVFQFGITIKRLQLDDASTFNDLKHLFY